MPIAGRIADIGMAIAAEFRGGSLYWFNTYETFQAASALCLKFSLYACMGAACPSA